MKIVCVGEILADFVPEGKCHILRPGGAPGNVAVNLARWGADSAVITRVGDDFLGRFLTGFVKDNGVDTSSVLTAKGYKTGLVFVSLSRNGERDFSFYGHPSADTMLSPKDVKPGVIKNCDIVHFGSISTMEKNNSAATLKAVELAKCFGKLVSYDPNVRLNLWEGRHAACKKLVKSHFKRADIIKISDTELKFLFNTEIGPAALDRIFRRDQLVFVSAGAAGCYFKLGNLFGYEPGVKVKAVDTTGAGDAFMAGVLYEVARMNRRLDLSREDLAAIAKFANRKGAEAVKRKGAV